MMRIACRLAIAGLAVVGGSQIALAADSDQPPGTGTTERDHGISRPMDHQGVIRPSDRDTQDRNQAEVPGTHDNPSIDPAKPFDRRRDNPGGNAIDPDHKSHPHQMMR